MNATDLEEPDEEQAGLVAIRVFTSEPEAGVAKAALEAFGIKCILGSSDAVGEVPSLRMAGVPLLVHAEDADRAEQVLSPKYRQ